ncbi:uncharacterized protein LOC143214837 [Lasioglossum baleicum]|uniref:uncharacterized protein LOC143214837 n=1 Tax=Lasioglossum baleicum TaxID=434251 RepID=UPI003FCDA7CB
MNWTHGLFDVDEDEEDDDELRLERNDLERLVETGSSSASSGRRIAARDSRAGEEDWTKRKKQNKTSKAEEAEEHKRKRRAKARIRVEKKRGCDESDSE